MAAASAEAPSAALGAALLASALGAQSQALAPPGLAPQAFLSPEGPPVPGPPLASSDPLSRALWKCSKCKAANSYLVEVCGECATSLFAPLVEQKAVNDVPEDQVLTYSLLPGGGFFVLGRPGTGAARLLLTVWALGLGLVLPGRVLVLKILFILAGLGVWGVSAIDALATRRRQESRVILRSKVIMILVGSLLALLVTGMVLSSMTSRAGSDTQTPVQVDPPGNTGGGP